MAQIAGKRAPCAWGSPQAPCAPAWPRARRPAFVAVSRSSRRMSSSSRAASGGAFVGPSASHLWLVPHTLISAPAAPQPDADAADASPSASAPPPPSPSPTPLTVYTLRLTTSFDRGAALSDPMAGVNVCLVGADGRAVLRRIAPVNDPRDAADAMIDICKVADDAVGANCSVVAPSSSSSTSNTPQSPPPPPSWVSAASSSTNNAKPRFQEGAVDEVSFLAPELGPLAALLVAPEGGAWALDEAMVVSSRTAHSDRFVCRGARLGGRRGEPAAYLTPVPPGAVVYGSGDGARILSREQAAVLHARGMDDYGGLRARVLAATALLAAGGSGFAALAGGPDAALPFAAGGAAGFVYQALLQAGVDAALPAGGGVAGEQRVGGAEAPILATATAAPRRSGTAAAALGSPALRLAFVSAAAVAAAWCVRGAAGTLAVVGAVDAGSAAAPAAVSPLPFALPSLGGGAAAPPLAAALSAGMSMQPWQLGVGMLGFMMYKLALVGVVGLGGLGLGDGDGGAFEGAAAAAARSRRVDSPNNR